MVLDRASDKRPAVRVVDDVLVGGVGDRVDVRIGRSDIRRVDMYKLDQVTVDLICCDVVFGQGEALRTSTFHEDLVGWDELMTWLATLPGFDAAWRAAVVQPPFAENRRTVFLAS